MAPFSPPKSTVRVYHSRNAKTAATIKLSSKPVVLYDVFKIESIQAQLTKLEKGQTVLQRHIGYLNAAYVVDKEDRFAPPISKVRHYYTRISKTNATIKLSSKPTLQVPAPNLEAIQARLVELELENFRLHRHIVFINNQYMIDKDDKHSLVDTMMFNLPTLNN